MLQVPDLSALLAGIPKGAWVALSKNEERVVAYAAELQDAISKANTSGETEPVLVRVPEDGATLLLQVALPTYEVRYSTYPFPPSQAFANGRTVQRPIIVVAVTNGESTLRCRAIVDSGADYCAFPRAFMQPLGLDALISPVEASSGVGNSNMPTHFCNVELDIGLGKFPVYAGFTTGLEQIGMGLLGQAGFFDRFHVTFRKSQGIFELETHR